MTTLVIKTNVSQATDVLIRDLGFLVPNSGGSITFTDLPNLQDCNTSVNLRTLATDDAFGVNNSTLILNDGSSDIAQSLVGNFLDAVSGTQGETGIQGSTGVRGVTGFIGLTGQTGIGGLQGITGFQGITGIQGAQGITGTQGLTGVRGITGFQGPTGVQGTTGASAQGVTGFIGVTGVIGGTGIQGFTGLTGSTGLTNTGIQGITGFVGITGIAYTSQIIGATGTITTTNTAYPAFASTGLGMALIPASGTYVVVFTSSVEQSANTNQVFVTLYLAGSEIVNTARRFMRGTGNSTTPISTQALVTVNGSQIVDMRWRVNTGTGTLYEKNMTFIKTS